MSMEATVKKGSSAEETYCVSPSGTGNSPPPPLPNSDPPVIPPTTFLKEVLGNWSIDDVPSVGTEGEENLGQRHDPPAILVEQDVEIEMILYSSAIASGIREVKSRRNDGDNRHSLLEPEDEKQKICDSGRRRSPVNVNEWVASLPTPSAIDAEDGHVNLSGSNSSRGPGRLQKCHKKQQRSSASDECDTTTSELCKPGWEENNGPSELAERATKERSKLVIGLKRLHDRAGQHDQQSDRDNDCNKPDSVVVDTDALSPNVDPDLSSYRRLSAVFEAIEEENRDKEERSDDEDGSHSNDGGEPNELENATDVDAKKVLATIEHDKLADGTTTIKCIETGCEDIGKKVDRCYDSDAARFLAFGGSDRLQVIKKKWMPSTDNLTSSSESCAAHKAVPAKSLEGHKNLEGLLLSRCVDPAQLLIDLGFGGPETSNLSRVPTRFLTGQSMAKGICVEGFLRHQEGISILDDASYQGGVDGLYSSAMLETLAQQSSSFDSQGSQGKPKTDSPASSTSFVDRVVNRRSSLLRSHTMSSLPILSAKREERGVSSFRSVAQSVLSPENRRFLKEQEFVHEKVKRQQSKKRLVLGGHAYNVDEDDISVVTAVTASDDATVPNDDVPAIHAASGDRTRIRRPLPTHNDAVPLNRMDTSTSLTSTCSVDSDWSDEEIEEMERIFGNITHRLNGCESRPNGGAVSLSVGAKWWQTLKNRRPTAVQKMLVGKKFGRSTDSESAEARRHKFSQSSAPSFDLEDCKNPSIETDAKGLVERSGVQSGDLELGDAAAAATQAANGINPETVAFKMDSVSHTVTSTSHGHSTPSQRQQHRHLIRGITHCDERIPIRFAMQQIW